MPPRIEHHLSRLMIRPHARGTATCSACRGLASGFGFPVYWMYLDGKDVVHIGRSAGQASDNQKAYLGRLAQDSGAGTGAIDHIAFRAKGLKQTMAHLRRHKVEFNERRANGQALYQLFMYDPNGIKVELNFDAAEAQGIEPEITAEKLAARK
jgi:hypothetical protein